jgi:ABC-2 type transport system permease protein
MSVIYMLWLRHLRHYWRYKSRAIASLAQPLLFLITLGFGFRSTYAKAGNGDYIQFLAPGIVAQAILYSAMFSGVDIIAERQFGILKESLVAPVPRSQIVVGRILGAATVALIQGALVGVFCFVAGFHPVQYSLLPLALVFMFAIAMLFAAIGTIVGSIVEDYHSFPLIMNFLVLPLFFLSGALFPLSNVSAALHVAMRANPLTYGVDGLRGSLTQVFAFGPGADIVLLSVMAVLLLSLSVYAFSKIEI